MCAFRIIKKNKTDIAIEIREEIDKTHCYNGHRPQKLNGFNIYSKDYDDIRKLVRRDIVEKYDKGKRNFITGGALGFDTICFEEIETIKEDYEDINNILAVPFENQGDHWFVSARLNYQKMLILADEIVVVDKLEPYISKDVGIGEYHRDKLETRSKYMIDFSSSMTSLWNFQRDNSGTHKAIKEAERGGLDQTFINSVTLDIYYNLGMFNYL